MGWAELCVAQLACMLQQLIAYVTAMQSCCKKEKLSRSTAVPTRSAVTRSA